MSHVRHFTRRVPAKVAVPCPKCGSADFKLHSGVTEVSTLWTKPRELQQIVRPLELIAETQPQLL